MQRTHFKKHGEYIIVDWDNEGKVGVDQNGKVWQNIDNPSLFRNTSIPNGKEFLKPLIDHLEILKQKYNL